jgi:hypothetical protein
MLKHLNILIAYFILAVALSFKLGFTVPVLLFVAQPAVLIALYWRKLSEFKRTGVHKIILTFFVIGYGVELFEYAYDYIVHGEAAYKKSNLLQIVFLVAFALSFVPAGDIEKDYSEP